MFVRYFTTSATSMLELLWGEVGSRGRLSSSSLLSFFMHLETLASVLLMIFINDSLWTFKRSSSVVGRMMVPKMISPYPDPYNLSVLSNMAKQMI